MTDHPKIENVNLAELWRTAPEEVPPEGIEELYEGRVTEYLAAGVIIRLRDDGPTYAWILGHRIGGFATAEDARRAIQNRLKRLLVGVGFERPQA